MKIVDAEAVYTTLTEYYHHRTDVQHEALREALDRVPEVTICGYPIRELVIFAEACRTQGVEIEQMKALSMNLEYAFEIIQKAMDKLWKDTLEARIHENY